MKEHEPMALLGVILLLVGVGAGVVAYLATHAASGTVAVAAFGFTRNATPFELVVYGAVAVLLFALGWAMVSAAARRRARLRREGKETTRLTEVEENAEAARLDHERRFQEAGLRDEDLRRRESELSARHEGLDTREAELSRREAEWRERESPSVADVVTGRAEGNVNEGTASWTDEPRTGSVERPAETRTGRRADRTDALDQTDTTDTTDTTTADPADPATADEREQRDSTV
jgi:membrane protein implicated in regulation of membrane protease activity